GNCVEYCPTNCLSMTEEYELSAYDRHNLNYDNVALGRLPYKVTQDPMVTPMRELAYLPKGVMDPHDLPAGARRAGKLPQEILEELEAEQAKNPPAESDG
ncbi:MAG: NAD(P)H-quinone oxidoreductase subunit I, partial [Cyanobacteria bacterium J06632_22]